MDQAACEPEVSTSALRSDRTDPAVVQGPAKQTVGSGTRMTPSGTGPLGMARGALPGIPKFAISFTALFGSENPMSPRWHTHSQTPKLKE